MINLKITMECPTKDCNHTVQLFPNDAVPGLYQKDCGGCGTTYECIALTPDELAWHDAQVVAAVTEKAKK